MISGWPREMSAMGHRCYVPEPVPANLGRGIFRGKPPANVAARKEVHVDLPGNDNKAVEAHMRNWVDAMNGKAKVIAPPEKGQEAAIGGHMATLSLRNQKKIIWDDTTKQYHFV